MKRILLMTCLIFFLSQFSYSQSKDDIVGTWYGKTVKQPFWEHASATARCFTKNKIKEYNQLLVIDANLNFNFSRSYKEDTSRMKGKLILSKDTFTLVPILKKKTGKGNGMNIIDKEISYYIYFLGKSELIYSYYPSHTVSYMDDDDENQVFSKVETDPEYDLTPDPFQKILYTALATGTKKKNDFVAINNYRVKIDSLGHIDPSTLEGINANQEYYASVKQGLIKLKDLFRPVEEHRRFKPGLLQFKLTY